METLTVTQYVLSGAFEVMQPANLLVMFVGLFVGILGGMLPGISTVTTVALFVPFTFAMPTSMAFIGLGAVFCGAMSGGANSAILINTPGQPAAMATAFDGYPMTRHGRAEEALYVALLASAAGGLFGALVLLFFFEPLSMMALNFGSEAFFWMGIFGLTTLASMFPGQVLKGLLGGALGLALSTVGLDPSTATPRFTFGSYTLVQGLDMVALMIGLFSISQMLTMLESGDEFITTLQRVPGSFRRAFGHIWRHPGKLLFASSLGTLIGALPGAGGNVASIVAYNEVKRWDKEPDRFGTGVPEGLLVPESANNASVGGALVPLLSLGIPGSASAAVLAGGLMAQGITPGPQLMELNPGIAYTFIISLIIANFGMVLIGYLMARGCTYILDVPKLYIIPAVISLSMFGAYALRSNMFDVLVMILSGGAAFLLMKGKVMPAAIALGLVLGPIIEESLVITIMRSKGRSLLDLMVFSPLAFFFLAASLAAVFVPMYLNRKHPHVFLKLCPASMTCLRRYDFWVIAALTAISAFFAVESLGLEDTPRLFPMVVFTVMTGLGLLILGFMVFEPLPADTASDKNMRINVAVFLTLIIGSYALINVLGFYASCFLCMLLMGFYGVFHIGQKPCTWRESSKVVGFSIAWTAAEYACFTMLLNVMPPQGILF